MRRKGPFHPIDKLDAMAAAFGVSRAANWNGFKYNQKNILFRYGKVEGERPKTPQYAYPDCPRFTWPFGNNSDDRKGKDFVLLQADLSGGRDFFYLIPIDDARVLADKYPRRTLRIVRNSMKKSRAHEIAGELEKYRMMSVDDVKVALGKPS